MTDQITELTNDELHKVVGGANNSPPRTNIKNIKNIKNITQSAHQRDGGIQTYTQSVSIVET